MQGSFLCWRRDTLYNFDHDGALFSKVISHTYEFIRLQHPPDHFSIFAPKCRCTRAQKSQPSRPLTLAGYCGHRYQMINEYYTKIIEFLRLQIIVITLTFIIVVLRFLCRFLIAKSPGWDDYTIIIAMV